MAILGTHYEIDEYKPGVFRHVQHMKPICYAKDGSLHRMTNALAMTGSQAFPVGVDELSYWRINPQVAGRSPLFVFGKGQSFMSVALVDANNVPGTVRGNSVYFANAWNNADLEYVWGGHRLGKTIYLRAGHPRKFSFQIVESVGLDLKTLSSSEWRILNPILEPPEGARDERAAMSLEWLTQTTGGRTILTCTLPDGDWAGWRLDPTLTLQPGPSDGKDTCIWLNFPTRNYGASPYLYANAWNPSKPMLLFDLTSISQSATCISATFYVYRGVTMPGGGATTSAIYSIAVGNADWPEGTKNATDGGAGDCCWNYKEQTPGSETAWAGSAGMSTAGTDYETPAIGSIYTGLRSDPVGTEYSCTLSAARVQAWFGAANTNYGFLCVPNDNNNAWASSDYGTAAYRPKLVVEYKLPAGMRVFSAPFVAPTGGVFV